MFVPWSRFGIFCNKRTRSTPLDPNSYFEAFYTIWVHWGWLHFVIKLSSKWAEQVQLMQKFMPQSRFGIFHNERAQSTQFLPKLLFSYVLLFLGVGGIVSLLHETRFKTSWTGAINAKVHGMKSCRNFSQRNALDPPHWILNSCFGAFHNVWVHLGPFHCITKLYSKRADLVQLMQKFVRQSCVWIFYNERTWSTPLDPKLMFWCVS